MASPDEYIAWGKDAILGLLEREHAFVMAELIAKVSERQPPEAPTTIDPHHLLSARAQLLDEDAILVTEERTRGQRPVSVHQPRSPRGRVRAIEDAGARKRLLYARYLGWSSGTPSQAGIIGPA